jgi:hypothetical protein
MNNLRMLVILILLTLFSPVGLTAGIGIGSEPVILTDTVEVYPLSLHLELLEDQQADLTINDVRTPNAGCLKLLFLYTTR